MHTPPVYHLTPIMCVGSQYNKVADHLSHNRVADALRCASTEFGVTLRRLPSHGAN